MCSLVDGGTKVGQSRLRASDTFCFCDVFVFFISWEETATKLVPGCLGGLKAAKKFFTIGTSNQE